LSCKEVVFKGAPSTCCQRGGKRRAFCAEVFVSMAKTEGGIVRVGVNDTREIVGIDELRGTYGTVAVNLCRNNCHPGIEPVSMAVPAGH